MMSYSHAIAEVVGPTLNVHFDADQWLLIRLAARAKGMTPVQFVTWVAHTIPEVDVE